MIDGGGAFQTGSEMSAAPAVRHILESYYGVEQSHKDPNPTDAKPLGEGPANKKKAAAPAE
jgi:hypothetical protein